MPSCATMATTTAMSNANNFLKIPSWDGKPRTWATFKRDFDWYLHSVKVTERRYIVARVEPRMRGGPEGASWLDNATKNVTNWKALAEHADGALLTPEFGKAIGVMKKDLELAEKAGT